MKTKFSLLVVGVVAFVVLFGWYAVRPSIIKHNCSWIKKHQDASNAVPAITEDEIKVKGMLEDCNNTGDENTIFAPAAKSICKSKNQITINEYTRDKPAIEEKDWEEKATDNEYKFCLRDKGL